MEIARPIPGWTPSTPEIRGRAIDDVLQRNPTIAIHFWAPWNGADPIMDHSIQAVAGGFADRLRFASCNVDLEENIELCRRRGVVSIPTLAILVSGMPRRLIVGCRGAGDLRNEIESRLREPESKPWWVFWGA